MSLQSKSSPQPFLKWVGGKRALLPVISPYVDRWRRRNPDGRYFEPFLGAGAVFLSLPVNIPKFGNDFNWQLIEAYEVVRDKPTELISTLLEFENSSDFFYMIREWDREPDFKSRTKVERAARFIYLNKTAFNGLYRVNLKGQYNVPFGSYKSPNFQDEENLSAVSAFLSDKRAVKLTAGDYRKATAKALPGDFVYFDPPYDPISETSSFTAYSEGGFTRENQIELRDECVRLVENGVQVLISNSSTKFIRKIYRESKYFRVSKVKIHRGISAKAESRGEISEFLISTKVKL